MKEGKKLKLQSEAGIIPYEVIRLDSSKIENE